MRTTPSMRVSALPSTGVPNVAAPRTTHTRKSARMTLQKRDVPSRYNVAMHNEQAACLGRHPC
eukprot:2189898-Ditylum_brightwellii.AAC.1